MVDANKRVEFHSLVYEAVAPILVRMVYRMSGSMEAAEEICQEAFIKLLQKKPDLDRFDDAKFWLIRVAKNMSLNHLKRRKREKKAYDRVFRETPTHAAPSDREVLRDEAKREIQALLDELPDTLRIPLIMREYGDLNYREISRVMGLSEGSVKVRVFRARERIAAVLEKRENVYVPR